MGLEFVPDFNVVIDVKYQSVDSTNPTIIVTPPAKVVSVTESEKLTTIIDASVGVIDSISNIVAIRDVYVESNMGVMSA